MAESKEAMMHFRDLRSFKKATLPSEWDIIAICNLRNGTAQAALVMAHFFLFYEAFDLPLN